MNSRCDFYFTKDEKWQGGLEQLRPIVLDCGLSEELKWGVPCYTFEGSNIVLIHVFKEYFALLFFKGALLKDANGVLVQQTENSQAARQIRFSSAGEVVELAPVLKATIQQAIEVEKAGLEVEFKGTSDFTIPEEFQTALEEAPALKTAFEALTPGRQRAYLLHFSAPKQAKTRQSRVEKCAPSILEGKGLNDR